MQARQQVPTTRNLSGICSLEPRVPPRVRPGESKHEYIEASSCGRLALGRDGMLHPELPGTDHCSLYYYSTAALLLTARAEGTS